MRSWLLLWFTLEGGAADPPAASSAPAPRVETDLRDEYIEGEAIVVAIRARNEGSAPLTFADLGARPWLVEFSLVLPSGQAQMRKTTPPPQDPGTIVTIPPRGLRQVLLEVPSGGAMSAGEYRLGVSVEGRSVADPRPVRIAPARPVGADLHDTVAGAGRQGLDAVWLHQAAAGYDLYLHQSDGSSPARRLGDWFLARLDSKADPALTVARGEERSGRYLTWTKGPRTLVYTRLAGESLRFAPRSVDLPWPRAEPAGQGATDGDGVLHVPVWVPAPRGEGGELRVVTVGDRGAPGLSRVSSYARRPAGVSTTVDGAGKAHLLVRTPESVDLYATRGTGADRGLPLPGVRLASAVPGERLVAAAFGLLGEQAPSGGGLAVLVLAEKAGVEPEPPVLHGRWLTFKGSTLREIPGRPWKATDTLLSVVPSASGTAGLVVRGADARVAYVEGERRVALAVPPAGDWGVVRDTAGQPWLLASVPGDPVRASRIE